jgi:hypothetical protein
MKIVNRPKRTTGELIALINQRRADWWPAEFRLTIDRSAEHDWIATSMEIGVLIFQTALRKL